MLQLNPKIDAAMARWFTRLRTLPLEEQSAIREAVKIGVRCDTCDEIGPALLTLDPVLSGLWAEWNDTLAAEAWRAVLRLVLSSRN